MDKIDYCNMQLKIWTDIQQTKSQTSAHNDSLLSSPFPYLSVIDCLRSRGKHFTPSSLLERLSEAKHLLQRQRLETTCLLSERQDHHDAKILGDFLACCLDKHQSNYEYKSYIGLPLFIDNTLPHRANFDAAMISRIELLKALLYDDYIFSARSYLGLESNTQDRRNAQVIEKRIDNIVRALTAFDRLSQPFCPADPDEQHALNLLQTSHQQPCTTTRFYRGLAIVEMLHNSVCDKSTVPLALLLKLSMQPVYINHEEYNFIRMLQVFEVIFSLLVIGLQNVIHCIHDNQPCQATSLLNILCTLFNMNVHLIRILKTMPREDFQIFRQFTEGASAIQSPQYKMLEVLMGKPNDNRLASPAFQHVPEIRQYLERSGLDLEYVLQTRYGKQLFMEDQHINLPEEDRELIRHINRLDSMLLDWKKRHFGIAAHMIGEVKGTGDTDGVAYLARFKGELFLPELDHFLSRQSNDSSASPPKVVNGNITSVTNYDKAVSL